VPAACSKPLALAAVVGDLPEVAFGDEVDFAVAGGGQVALRRLRVPTADPTIDVLEVDAHLQRLVVFGLLELDVLVVAAGGLARERNRVQRVARAGAEKVEVLAVRRPCGLVVEGVLAGDVDGFAAPVGGQDPEVPRAVGGAPLYAQPAHIGRPREVASAQSVPVRAWLVQHLLRLARLQVQHEQPAVRTRDPEAELFAVGRKLEARHIGRAIK
jgi:hypothetical protein